MRRRRRTAAAAAEASARARAAAARATAAAARAAAEASAAATGVAEEVAQSRFERQWSGMISTQHNQKVFPWGKGQCRPTDTGKGCNQLQRRTGSISQRSSRTTGSHPKQPHYHYMLGRRTSVLHWQLLNKHCKYNTN
jgi:hypothetical protein